MDNSDRPLRERLSTGAPPRPLSAPAPPPPAAGSFEDQQATELANFKERWSAVQSSLVLPQVPPSVPPVGVRDGDVLIIGTSELDAQQADELADSLKAQLHLAVSFVFIPGHSGVTVLRSER